MNNFNIIEKDLINFQKPGRYIGNEIGIPEKDFINSSVRFAICYPDLYEIGMSNKGIQIIYNKINEISYASCERVFSVWPDFEEYLIKNDFSLFSLETKTPINNFDILGFSLQYELLFTNFLNILKLSKINFYSKDRKNGDPIIIAGGPAVVNPAPYSPFIDLFLIGEAENSIKEFIEKFRVLKQTEDREKIILELSKINGFFSPVYSKNIVSKSIYMEFINNKGIDSYILPNIEIVQNKLVVEIMRGCPNKCRFCQAGILYKPHREKQSDVIFEEINDGINLLGSNEVTLSSLSSADYSEIIELTNLFNKVYKKQNISFSLPSIRVESFNTRLLEKISSIRKSGLTFAIETGNSNGQAAINKTVMLEKMLKIIDFAVKNGWRLIKLYFMVGLPFVNDEVKSIISFVDDILKKYKKIFINLNVATFVPKPHTPFQYEKQLNLNDAIEIFIEIENYYRKSRVAVKKHDPYTSYIEGFIARGDENVGLAVFDAFKNGAKFDGWKEFFDYNIYKNSFEKNYITYEKYLSIKDSKRELAWDNIDIGASKEFLENEIDKAKNFKLTKSCKTKCDKFCNICTDKIKTMNIKKIKNSLLIKNKRKKVLQKYEKSKYLLEFSKNHLQKFLGHIDVIKYFERLFIRSKIELLHSSGFNPHPRMQFSSALSLGVESSCELLEFFTTVKYDENELISILKKNEHKEIPINKLKMIDAGKKISLIENIESIVYSLNYSEKEYSLIKIKYDCFFKNKISYLLNKKNKQISGIYNDFIELMDFNNLKLLIKLNKTKNIPNIFQICKDIFNVSCLIKKEKIFSKKDSTEIELYNYIC